MDGERLKEVLEKWGVALVVGLAVIVGLNYKSLAGDTIADAVKDLGQAMIPVFAAVFAARKVAQSRPAEERFLVAGESALRALVNLYPKELHGPKASRDKQDTEKAQRAPRYLFLAYKGPGQRPQLIPLDPLADGIVRIRVSPTSLKALGIEAARLGEMQQQVAAAVVGAAKAQFSGDFEESLEKPPSETQHTCVELDFDEHGLGERKFRKAIVVCGKAAMETLLKAQPTSPR
jgi:hypothetical protein